MPIWVISLFSISTVWCVVALFSDGCSGQSHRRRGRVGRRGWGSGHNKLIEAFEAVRDWRSVLLLVRMIRVHEHEREAH